MSEPESCTFECPAPQPLRLECVIVCDKYSDFLQMTLPHNKYLFGQIVVVTSWEDKQTQRICEYNHVKCVRTDETESRKGHFRKGAAINVGLAELAMDGAVVHLDADIYLPPQTKLLLANCCLDKRTIYGCDRFLVRGWEAWQEFVERPRLLHEDETYVHLKSGFPLGTRVMHKHAGGYMPIGFFQLWFPRESGVYRYPEGHTDAGREDTEFAAQWPRSRRGFIPEIVGYHLESDDAANAANWGGRQTAPFSFRKEQAR